MNDLERDLKELFESKARDVDAGPAAPVAVLRRGRRRQAATVLGGAVGGLAVVAVGVAIVLAAIDGPRTDVPGGGQRDLPERRTSIGGVPVTAPAGWTLVNDWPLATILSTSSKTCTFTGTGVPVGDAGTAEATPAGDETCVETPAELPAGVPVLQLANFQIPLLETVCGLGDQPPTTLPSDGVAVYVAIFPNALTMRAFEDACPGSVNTTGTTATTFADRDVEMLYGAIAVAGPTARAEDLAVAEAYLEQLGGIRITDTVPSSTQGPGYVLAAGDGAESSWRLEAGIIALSTDGVELGVPLVTITSGAEGYETLPPAAGGNVADDAHDYGDGVITWGTAGPLVQGVEVVTADGATTATRLAWPTGLFGITEGSPLDGFIWLANTTTPGEVRAIVSGGEPTSPADDTPMPGDVVTSGADGLSSWAFLWTEAGCPVLEVVTTRDDATGRTESCVPAWDGDLVPSYIGGVYGAEVATIVLVGPEGMYVDTTRDHPGLVASQCGVTLNAPGWQGSGICVVSLEVGQSVRLVPRDIDGAALGDAFELRAADGSLFVSGEAVAS